MKNIQKYERKMKKFLASLLALVLILASFVNGNATTVMASESSTYPATEQATRYVTAPENATIIYGKTDETRFSVHGNYSTKTSSAIKNPDNSSTLYITKTNGSGFSFDLSEFGAGTYEICYWVDPHQGSLSPMTLTINNGSSELGEGMVYWRNGVFNTATADAKETDIPGGWVSLGEYTLPEGHTASVDFVHPGDTDSSKGSHSARVTSILVISKNNEETPTPTPGAGEGEETTPTPTPGAGEGEGTTPTPTPGAGEDATPTPTPIEQGILLTLGVNKNPAVNEKWTLTAPGQEDNKTVGFDDRAKGWAWSGKSYNVEGQYIAYTNAHNAGFTVDFSEVNGVYEVFYYVYPNTIGSSEMTFEITHQKGVSKSGVEEVTAKDSNAETGWISLGTFEFNGEGNKLETSNIKGNSNFRATAVKLMPGDREDIAEEHIYIANDNEKAELKGSWEPSDSYTYDGNATIFTDETDAEISYKIGGLTPGNYELFLYEVPDVDSADMLLSISEDEDSYVINASKDATQGAGWVSLGVFAISGNADETVTFGFLPGTTGTSLHGTAIKLVQTTARTNYPDIFGVGDNETSDVTAFEGFSYEGDWRNSTKLQGPLTKYTQTFWISEELVKKSEIEDYCKYDPGLESSEPKVKISVYLLYWNTMQTTNACYEVHHNGKVDTFNIDMHILDRRQESSWYELGIFDFSGTEGEEFVKLIPQITGEENDSINTRASAVRFEILNANDGSVFQTIYVTPDIDAYNYERASMNSFRDIPKEHESKYAVEYLGYEGIVSGLTDENFGVDEDIIIADFISYVCKAIGMAESEAAILQDGIPSEVLTDATVSKEEAVQILYNAMNYIGKNTEWIDELPDYWNSLKDGTETSEWALDALKVMYRCNVIDDNLFEIKPKETLTRGQAAMILCEFAEQFVWAGPPVESDEEWVLTFQDEFQGDSLNWHIWRSEDHKPGHIASSRHPENVEVSEGSLKLISKAEEKNGAVETAASIWVDAEIFQQSYGYWEARYKYADIAGLNQSFWMYSERNKTSEFAINYKHFYELDVNEGRYKSGFNTCYHERVTENGEKTSHGEKYRSPYDLSLGYHTYGLEWIKAEDDETYGTLNYYLDGRLIHTKPFKSFDENGTINTVPILSTALIVLPNGFDPIKEDGKYMEVDYVRVWQKASDVNSVLTKHGEQESCKNLTYVEAKDATSTEAGHVEYWKCTYSCESERLGRDTLGCGKVYADAEGTQEIALEDLIIPIQEQTPGTGEGEGTTPDVKPEIILEGTDKSYTKGANATASIHCTGDLDDLAGVKMDGKEVDKANYTLKEGSIIVTFKAEYLETLSAGEHIVTLLYAGGHSVDSTLTVLTDVDHSTGDTQDDASNEDDSDEEDVANIADTIPVEAISSPSTGDDSNLILWIMLLAAAIGVYTYLVANKRRVK